MNKFKFSITLFLIMFAFTVQVMLADNTGTSGGQFLKICVDAKAAALGGVGATSSGSGSIFLNPSGLAKIENMDIKFSQISWLEGINYSNISIGKKNDFGILALGINYLTVPSITKYDNTGNRLSDSYSPSDMALNISYASMFKDIRLGTNLKYISSTIDDKTATAYAIDLGLQKTFKAKNFELGLAIQNLGTELKFYKESDPLPLNYKFGGRYVLPINSKSDDCLNITNGFNFLADINFTNDTGFYSGIGAEYLKNIKGMETALRFGYNTNVKGLDRLGGFSSGIGLTYKKYTLDYAIAPYGEFGLTHRISISVIF